MSNEKHEAAAGGPWTRHGHVIDGITVAGAGRPPIARCGGPGLCGACSVDAERVRNGAKQTGAARRAAREELARLQAEADSAKPEERIVGRKEAAEAFTTWWDDNLWCPFVEDDNANITGIGHQAPAAFVAAVAAYDRVNDDKDAEAHPESDVQHRWALITDRHGDGDLYAEPCEPDDPNAIPVTTIWNVR